MQKNFECLNIFVLVWRPPFHGSSSVRWWFHTSTLHLIEHSLYQFLNSYDKKEIIRFFLDAFLGVVANSWSELSFKRSTLITEYWSIDVSGHRSLVLIISTKWFLYFLKKDNCSLKPYKCEMVKRKGNPNHVGSGLFSCFLDIIISKWWVTSRNCTISHLCLFLSACY